MNWFVQEDFDFEWNPIARAIALYYWTPNFNGVNSYGELISAWQPTGADWEIEVVVYFKDPLSALVQSVIDNRNTGVVRSGMIEKTGGSAQWQYYDNEIVTLSPFSGSFASFTITSADVGSDFGPGAVTTILARKGFESGTYLDGQIHSIKLTDLNDSSNSIEIDTVIRAAEMPSDTYLYNSLDTTDYPELVVNCDFSSPDLTGWSGGNATGVVVDGELHVTTLSTAHNYKYTLTTTPLTIYKFIFYAKLGTMSRANYSVYDNTNIENIISPTTYNAVQGEFTKVTIVFVAPLGCTSASVYVVRDSGVTGTAFFDNVSVKQTNIIGQLFNLGTDQPYVPQLKGGEIDRSQVDGKFEMYLGSYSVGDFDNGVDTTGAQLSVPGTQVGSTEFTGFEDYIIVLKTGAVLKLTTIPDANTANYSVLLGTDAQIQAGAEYPNVFRVLEPDADVNSEYYHYDNGGSYPWIP